MKLKFFRSNTRLNRPISLLLVLLLLSAALHVSQHDLTEDSGGSFSHSDCQLSHVPGMQLCVPPAPVPLLALVFILAFATSTRYLESVLRHRRIRGPPLAS
ncbi:MAG: hypothetical protein Q8L89_07035 [Gammaproteobacteria bacterium]|nr:hypothetical protein [Gammaproteobacteria bacterium]